MELRGVYPRQAYDIGEARGRDLENMVKEGKEESKLRKTTWTRRSEESTSVGSKTTTEQMHAVEFLTADLEDPSSVRYLTENLSVEYKLRAVIHLEGVLHKASLA